MSAPSAASAPLSTTTHSISIPTQILQSPAEPKVSDPGDVLQSLSGFSFATEDEWDTMLERFSDTDVIEELSYSVKNAQRGMHNGKIKHSYISKKSLTKGENVTVLMSEGQTNGRIKQYTNSCERYRDVPGKEKFYRNNEAWLSYWEGRKTEFK
jgi:hypothetical protein